MHIGKPRPHTIVGAELDGACVIHDVLRHVPAPLALAAARAGPSERPRLVLYCADAVVEEALETAADRRAAVVLAHPLVVVARRAVEHVPADPRPVERPGDLEMAGYVGEAARPKVVDHDGKGVADAGRLLPLVAD